MTVQVVSNGKICFITGIFQVSLYDQEGTGISIDTLYQLEPIEAINSAGEDYCFHVRRQNFMLLPSAIEFSTSEWTRGIINGRGA